VALVSNQVDGHLETRLTPFLVRLTFVVPKVCREKAASLTALKGTWMAVMAKITCTEDEFSEPGLLDAHY
jgi:hypothetical protein